MKNNPEPSDEVERVAVDTALESQLRRIELPRGKINRDQLMYDAGWAAAMASLENADSPGVLAVKDASAIVDGVSVSPGLNNSVSRFWHVLSGVSSIAALVFAGLFFLGDRQPFVENGRTDSFAQGSDAHLSNDEQDVSVAKKGELLSVADSQPPSGDLRVSQGPLVQMMGRWPDDVSLSVSVLRGDPGMARSLAMAESTGLVKQQSSEPEMQLRSGSWKLLDELGFPVRPF